MMESLAGLLPSTGFEPHGHCFLWTPSLLCLYVVSDSTIALSYYVIPFALIYFVRRRADLAFPWVFVMFGAFILACGTTHLLGVWTIGSQRTGSTAPSKASPPRCHWPPR